MPTSLASAAVIYWPSQTVVPPRPPHVQAPSIVIHSPLSSGTSSASSVSHSYGEENIAVGTQRAAGSNEGMGSGMGDASSELVRQHRVQLVNEMQVSTQLVSAHRSV